MPPSDKPATDTTAMGQIPTDPTAVSEPAPASAPGPAPITDPTLTPPPAPAAEPGLAGTTVPEEAPAADVPVAGNVSGLPKSPEETGGNATGGTATGM